MEGIDCTTKMTSFQQNIDCAKLVQSYLIPGSRTLAGVFHNGNLIGLFPSKAEILGKLMDDHHTYIIPISYKKVSPRYTDPEYSIKRAEINLRILNVMREHQSTKYSTIGWIELLFLVLMQYPDMIASSPEFRTMFKEKAVEFKTKLDGDSSAKFHYSTIIVNEAPAFMNGLYRHIDFADSIPKPRNVYRLRPRNPINYALFNYKGTK